jgi:hypothetical protein
MFCIDRSSPRDYNIYLPIDRELEFRSGQTKDYKIGIGCFSAKHAELRGKSKDWHFWDLLLIFDNIIFFYFFFTMTVCIKIGLTQALGLIDPHPKSSLVYITMIDHAIYNISITS